MIFHDGEYLEHIGTPHAGTIPHSGRYEYGSGEHPFQRGADFYNTYNRYKAQGLTPKVIAEKMGVVDRYGKPNVKMLTAKYSNAKAEKRAEDRQEALDLLEACKGNVSEVGRRMGINESSVRSLLDEGKAQRNDLNRQTAEVLKKYIDENRYVDISPGVNHYLGVTQNRIDNAVALLEEDGYKKNLVYIDQMGTNHKTTITVMTPPDCDYAELSEHKFDIKFAGEDSKVVNETGDILELGSTHPQSVSSDRILIRYNEEGGLAKDGCIELRRGVDDISLGGSQYAQVRIGVDDTHYLKGMAVYSDKIPPGYDIVFNTNKHLGTPPGDVFKKMERITNPDGTKGDIDWSNPFGSSYTSLKYTDADGKTHLSAINVVRKEGEWQEWSKNLASQFLSKQPIELANRQLKQSLDDKKLEFDEIKALTNPEIKKKLLLTYADKCDSLAVELKAAPFSGQQTHVILPFPELKDNEIYAPNYKDGTRVALIRYPHGGTFEIPELTVRNTGSPAAKTIKNAPDAVGINSHVAERLSGADFDGDTVVLIPLSEKVRVRTKEPLEGLKDFDPKERYPKVEGMKVLTEQAKGTEMGKVTNLITDMTLKGAGEDEIARAVRHSMVIIDAAKHGLNYKLSEKDNNIQELKRIYQDNGDGKTGAGTIISRASAEYDVKERREWYPSSTSIGPNGEKIQKETGNKYLTGRLKGIPMNDGTLVNVKMEKKSGRLYFLENDPATGKSVRKYVSESDFPDDINKLKEQREVSVNKDKKTGQLYYLQTDTSTGKKVRVYTTEDDFSWIKEKDRMQKSTRMAEAKDAYELTSGGSKENPGYRMEKVYAEYANGMKKLANAARLEYLNTKPIERNKEASVIFKDEIASLDRKLKDAQMHAPLERQAQLMANRIVAMKKEANPGMSKDDISKLKSRAIDAARTKLKSTKPKIDITDREWEAIQSGGISKTKLAVILENADLDKLKERATPRVSRTITPNMKALAKSMEASGYTTAQIADRLGISASSVYTIVKGKE